MDYSINVGDRFYCNNYSVKNGQALPDFMKVKSVTRDFIVAKCEARSVGNRDRVFSRINLWNVSNKNPMCIDPVWIFKDDRD